MAKKKRKISKKKRLNIKVAIIGLVVLGVIAGTVFLIWYKRGRDPQAFISEAETALQNKDYEAATNAYGSAYNFSGQQERISILFKLAEIALMSDPGDPELGRDPKQPNWRKAMGYFNKITTEDPENIDARRRILDYAYRTADTGQVNNWEMVKEVSQEIIDLCEESEDQEPSLFTLLARGRASLEIALIGQTSGIEEEVKEANDYLVRLLKRDADNFDALWYLAHAEIMEGELKENAGVNNGWEEGVRRAEIVLSESIDRNPDNPDAYLNMLKLRILQTQEGKDRSEAKKQLEAQQQTIKEKFPENPEIDYEIAGFYMGRPKDMDKAMEAIERAVSRRPEKMDYVIRGSRIAYINYRLKDEKEYLDRAIELALAGLDLPDAQETTGPNEIRNRNNRLNLNSFVVKYYIAEALSLEQGQRQEAISSAESHIHEMKQVLAVEENPTLVRWRAMVDLAKGDRVAAVRGLLDAYKQRAAMDNIDPELAYDLASIIPDEQVGAKQKYLGAAIENGITSAGEPDAILEFARLLLRLRSPDTAISLIQRYEEVMEESERSQELLVNAYIQANLYDKAEKILESYGEDSPKALSYKLDIAHSRLVQLVQMKSRQELLMESFAENRINALKDEINELRLNRFNNAKLLLKKKPELLNFGTVSGICMDLVAEDLRSKAIELNEAYLEVHPDSFQAKVLRKRLALPDPAAPGDDTIELPPEVAQFDEEQPSGVEVGAEDETLRDIQVEVAEEISDELKRLRILAQIQSEAGNYKKALDYYKQALELEPENEQLIASVFDSAVASQDFETAESLWEDILELNIDKCGGTFFSGRLAMAQENYEKAKDRFRECIEIRPLFPIAYLNMSIIYNSEGEITRAIEYAEEAVELNPLNPQITMNQAMLLYKRNQQLGADVTVNQREETANAILRAIKMNPSNINLQSIYAEYIADSSPENALAIRQSIFNSRPTKENALLLARMALKNAKDPWDSPKKMAMYRLADDAYQSALSISPGDPEVLDAYADFYRISGQEEKINELIGDNKNILWRAYYRSSKFEKAKEILEELYAENPDSPEILKGLIGVSLKLFRNDDVDRYSKELLEVENNFDNRLLRVQSLVQVGETTMAENEIVNMPESDKSDSKVMMLRATIAMRKGLFDKAIERIEEALDNNPQNATAWRIKGRANYLQGDYEQALRDFLESKKYREDNVIRIELAKTYDRMARYEPAIAELNLTLEEEGTPRVALMLLEEVYRRSRKYSQLREYYESMAERYAESSYWQRRRADLEQQQGNLDLASKYYMASWERSLDVSPTQPDIKALRGYFDVLLERERFNDLLSYASKYVDKDYGPEVYTAMGEAKARMGDIENALKYFGNAMEKAGYSFGMIDNAIERMIGSLDRNTITEWIKNNLQKNPHSINRNLIAFHFNLQSQNYNRAIKYLDNCIELTENQPGLQRAVTITKANTLQMAYKKVPDKSYLDQAVDIYEGLLEESPGDVSLLNNLAYLLASSEVDIARAEEVAARAYTLAPENGLVLDTYGYALIKNRKYEKAEQLLSRAIQTLELSATAAPYEIYEHLGLALERMNKPQEAKAAYERALEIGADELTDTQKEDMQERVSRLSRRIF